jgi:hypothetical protein
MWIELVLGLIGGVLLTAVVFVLIIRSATRAIIGHHLGL